MCKKAKVEKKIQIDVKNQITIEKSAQKKKYIKEGEPK